MWYKWPECFKCPNVQSDQSVQSIQNVLNINSEQNVHINQRDQIVQRDQIEQSNQSVMLVKSHQNILYKKYVRNYGKIINFTNFQSFWRMFTIPTPTKHLFSIAILTLLGVKI